MSKRKKKPLRPRVQRMNRAGRLQSARTWLPKYDGSNVLRSYCKHFAVDWRCAAKELQLLGVALPTEYLQRRELTESAQIAKRKQAKQTATKSKVVDFTTPDVTDAFSAYLAGDYAVLHAFECERDGIDLATGRAL